MSGARQDRFLGALMGMGVGDALGMPVAGMTAGEISARYGAIDRYRPRQLGDGVEIKAGEFTDESELALCIVESITVNDGVVDLDNIGARFLFLARGEAKRWMGPDTLHALREAEASLDFVVPVHEDGPVSGDVAARGIPIGLLHAVGTLDEQRLRQEAESVTRITHGSPAAIAAATAVAFAVQLAARGTDPTEWAIRTAAFLGGGSTAAALAGESAGEDWPAAAATVATAVSSVAAASSFEEALLAAVNQGGEADACGAIAGALAGARWGIAGIPQRLIDDLEGRIYVSLAAPWFYRTALRRSGLVIDLKTIR